MNQMSNFYGPGNGGAGGNPGGNLPGPLSKFGNMMSLIGKFRQFMSNPFSAFMDCNLNIPQNLRNNPDGIINYMRSSGVMNDDQYNQASWLANLAQGFLGGR